jgi:hypothetical protein
MDIAFMFGAAAMSFAGMMLTDRLGAGGPVSAAVILMLALVAWTCALLAWSAAGGNLDPVIIRGTAALWGAAGPIVAALVIASRLPLNKKP